MKKLLICAATAFLLLSCDNEFETDVNSITVSTGDADFSKYIAVGNSLTSGYRDGALYIDGQLESFPSMLAQQMKLVGGGEFKQPLMNDNLGGMPSVGFLNKRVLTVENGSFAVVEATGTGTSTLASIYANGPYQNMGVPGAKSFHLIAPGYGSAANLTTGKANPYFVRFASSTTTSVLQDAVAQNPTFFSLWIGNNDVLGYATSGGDGSNDITPTATFKYAYDLLINGLTANGAKGVVANIPNVTSIPFFTTVPYNAITLNEATATNLNTSILSNIKRVLTAFGQGDRIQLAKAGNNPILITDETLTDLSAQITAVLIQSGMDNIKAGLIGTQFGQARHATSEDLIPLTTRASINTVKSGTTAENLNIIGITYPLNDAQALTKTEKEAVLTATEAYNKIISEAASSKGLAFVDANAKMIELSQNSGITFDGVTYKATFVSGGAFSLDAVHLTGRGYAVIANEFIKAINKQYHSTLPLVNPNNYSGVTFP